MKRPLHQPTGSAPIHRDEATRSWWMDADTREAFHTAAERERERMERGPGARWARGITVGGFKTVTGGK